MSKAQYDKIFKYIGLGKEQGAKCVTGGEKRAGKGYFVEPTSTLYMCTFWCWELMAV